jgi:HSP20 family protein
MAQELMRWNPMQEIRDMQRQMDRFFYGWPRVAREDVELTAMDEALAVDIFEKGNNIVVKTALPGVDPKDIVVNITDGVLLIQAETKAEENVDEGNYHRREYRYGKTSRSFRLPENVDTQKVTSAYHNGMLRLTFPKTDAAKAKSIRVPVT